MGVGIVDASVRLGASRVSGIGTGSGGGLGTSGGNVSFRASRFGGEETNKSRSSSNDRAGIPSCEQQI